MIWRQICQRNAWISGRRIVRGYAKRVPFVSSVQKTPFLGVSPLIRVSRYATALVALSNLNNSCTTKCWFSSQALVDPPIGGIIEVPLAQTGEGIAECELLKWFVQEGDKVEEFQPLCEVQSDKATIEITSRYKGEISKVLYDPGDIVKVGEALVKMIVEESQAPTVSSDNLDTVLRSETRCLSSENIMVHKDSVGGVLATPAVRNLAKQYGFDINDICGTGKDRRVLKEDVEQYAVNKEVFKGTAASPHAHSIDESRIKDEKSSYPFVGDGFHYEDKAVRLRGFQRAMIKSMTMAAKVPHFHYLEEINCDALIELKASFQSANSDPNVKHTYMPFLIKSLSMALNEYPLLNSSFIEESEEVTLKGCHNVGVAMATPHGLVVPNIKKVQSLSILEITKELSRLQHLGLNNKLSSEDISGGTITLSNIGAIGGKFGSPLLNLPEVAIIAMGRIQKVPRFTDDGDVYPASIINVNIGADHRVVDGATVAKFCNEWKHFVENPELLLLHMR